MPGRIAGDAPGPALHVGDVRFGAQAHRGTDAVQRRAHEALFVLVHEFRVALPADDESHDPTAFRGTVREDAAVPQHPQHGQLRAGGRQQPEARKLAIQLPVAKADDRHRRVIDGTDALAQSGIELSHHVRRRVRRRGDHHPVEFRRVGGRAQHVAATRVTRATLVTLAQHAMHRLAQAPFRVDDLVQVPDQLIGHLHEVIDAEWRLGEPVHGVLRQGNQGSPGNPGGRYVLRTPSDTPEFDRVVIASPSYAAADMVRELDAGLGKRVGAIDYSPVAVVGLGYRQLDRELPGFGLLTTTSAKLPVLGVLWDSSIFPDRAPEGGRIVRLIIGGQRNPELVDQDEQGLVRTALDGVRATMGLSAEPDVTYVKRWPRGIPSYAPGHIGRVDAIFERLASHRGLYLNSNAYRGIAMNDCVRNGRVLAERIVGEGG